MDPVLGTTIVGITGTVGAIAIAIITGRNNANTLRLEDLVRRLKRRLIDKHGEDPDDVDDI